MTRYSLLRENEPKLRAVMDYYRNHAALMDPFIGVFFFASILHHTHDRPPLGVPLANAAGQLLAASAGGSLGLLVAIGVYSNISRILLETPGLHLVRASRHRDKVFLAYDSARRWLATSFLVCSVALFLWRSGHQFWLLYSAAAGVCVTAALRTINSWWVFCSIAAVAMDRQQMKGAMPPPDSMP